MKKNKIMRLASFLLVAVMLSTCAISGTFAKYTTSNGGSDTARVAKWGVQIAVDGGAFAKNYDVVTGDAQASYTVSSSTDDKLVAPGTSGTFSGVSITGTPEVSVQITKTATLTLNGWEIPAPTQENASATAFYCPIVFTINGTTITGTDYTTAASLISAVETAIEAGNNIYAPNTNLANISGMNGNYGWTWAIGSTDEVNTKDTALGDAAATNATTPSISLTVSVTVEQVD